MLGAAIPSLLVLGFFAGFDRRSLRIVAISLAVALFLGAGCCGSSGADSKPPAAGAARRHAAAARADRDHAAHAGFVAIAVALAVVAIVVLITLWMRRPRVEPEDDDEERWIDHGDESERDVAARRRRGSRLGRRRPADAVAAYRMLLEDLERRAPACGGRTGETPAEHAARLREHGGRGARARPARGRLRARPVRRRRA